MKDKGNSWIDEGRQIDDLFRQGLEDLSPEPSQDLWKGINRKLWWDEISHFTFTNLSKVLLIGGITGVMILVTALMVVVVPQAKSSDENTASGFSLPDSYNNSLIIPVSSMQNQSNLYMINKAPDGQNTNEYPTESNLTLNTPPSEKSVKEPFTDPVPSSQAPYFPNTSGTSAEKNEMVSKYDFLSFMEAINNEDLQVVITNYPAALVTPAMIENIVKVKPPTPRFFSLDMGVAPEVTFNSNNTSASAMSFSGNLGFNYNIGRFSIGSGVGISYITDDGTYRIDYKSKDSVGFYNMVVSYAVNQQDPSEIIYTTQRMIVYDSIQHIADDRTRNRYTYLQIPLFAGFRMLETSRLGLSIHAGPMVSFLIGEKEAEPVIDYANARIIRIEKNTPVRITTNWQFLLGLRLDYKINKEFSLFAEPYYKYYFSPIVEQDENPVHNPYSIGLGIGLQYNFERKTQKP